MKSTLSTAVPTSLYWVWRYWLFTATVYYTSVTKTHKLMNKDLKWWNTLRRCINKIVHAAYSKTTEATTLFSENTTMKSIYHLMLKILIFHNWKRKVQFSNKMVQHSPFSNSVQCVLNGVTAPWQLFYVTGYMKREIVDLKYQSMRLWHALKK
jgi:hypothetical protein